jgi:aryl-alcohol dehydrogenase-like predicted oxidoreductase
VEYRGFGRTGVRVSILALGCAGFGGVGSERALFGRGESEAQAFALMDAAVEAGINYFDTANTYGGGRSEEMIGRWLDSRGGRHDVFLATKVGAPVGDGINRGGLSRRHIHEQVDASLLRLGTDWIDLYMAHQVDLDTPIEETLGAFDDLVRAGKVRYVGACNIEGWRAVKAAWMADSHGLARFEAIQNEHHLLRRREETEVLAFAGDQQIAITPHSPLAGGWLTGKYRGQAVPPPGSRMAIRPGPYGRFSTARTAAELDAVAEHAGARGVTMGTLALAWLLADPVVTSVLIGPRSLDQLTQYLTVLDLRLDAESRRQLSDALDAASAAPGSGPVSDS